MTNLKYLLIIIIHPPQHGKFLTNEDILYDSLENLDHHVLNQEQWNYCGLWPKRHKTVNKTSNTQHEIVHRTQRNQMISN